MMVAFLHWTLSRLNIVCETVVSMLRPWVYKIPWDEAEKQSGEAVLKCSGIRPTASHTLELSLLDNKFLAI